MNTWPVELTLDNCIKCTICVTACPVAAVTDRFPGPKYEGPQGARFRHAGQPAPDLSVDYCSGCRVCNMVCPTGVKIAEINARARAFMVERGRFSRRTRLRNNLLARPETLGRWGHRVAPLANALLHNRWARLVAHVVLGIDRRAPLPTLAGERFTAWFRGRAAPLPAGERRVVYFHGCSTEYYEPRVGRAAVRVLEANGFEVIVPPQGCCGLPLLSNGEFGAARAYYRENVRRLVEYARQGYAIVGTSTSCTLTLKEEAPELLDIHDDDARLLAAHTFDLSEFLLALDDRGELRADMGPVPGTVLYHAPCQYRAHRLGAPSLELLRRIPELDVIESRADCCGIAGTYGFKREKYEIAMRVGRPLFDHVRESGVSLVACDSETCRWQIVHATGVQAVHPVELLAKAYGVE